MKRITTLVLLLLFLLNVLGYYGVFVGWQVGNSKQARSRLDRDEYSQGQAVTLKVRLTVPYSTDQEEYQRVDGEFEHEGEFYRLVKQRLYKDTLYIVCVKDDNLREMHQALTDYVKTFADSPINSAKSPSNGKTVLNFIKEYVTSAMGLKSQNNGWSKKLVYFTPEASPTASFSPSINHPPEG